MFLKVKLYLCLLILLFFGFILILAILKNCNWLWNEKYIIQIQNLNESDYGFETNISIFKINSQYYTDIDGVIYPKSVQLYLNKSINFDVLNRSNGVKRILVWNSFFGKYSYNNFGLGKIEPFQKNKCPVIKCELTKDKRLFDRSDLVIFHMMDFPKIPVINRPKKQIWTFLLYESPANSYNYTKFNSVFNMTSTYKIGSDFSGFYESSSMFYWQRNNSFEENFDFFSGKSKFAVAIISNCKAKSERLDFINKLKLYVDVDLYGNCGEKCPRLFNNSMSGDCKAIVASEYKFYLAFENSICQDYITEKFFGILKYNIIPVVFGGGPYDYYVIYIF